MREGLYCSLCNKVSSRSSFSRGQLKRDEQRQCTTCVAILLRLSGLSEDLPSTHDDRCQSVSFILTSLRKYPEHRGVQMDGLVALAHCCCDWAGGRDTAYSEGALTVVLDAVGSFLHRDSSITARGLLALGNLCNSAQRALVAYESKALTFTLEGMRQHPDDYDVQRFGASVVANICGYLPRVVSRAISEDAFSLLICGLKKCQDDVAVVANSLHALATLANSCIDEGIVAKSGIVTIITEMMALHIDAVEVQRNGLEALGNFGDGSVELRRQALLAGAAEMTLHALQRWGNSSEELVEAAVCGTLDAIMQEVNTEQRLGSENGMTSVLEAAVDSAAKAARHFAHNEALVREAKRLCDLADDPTLQLKRLRI